MRICAGFVGAFICVRLVGVFTVAMGFSSETIKPEQSRPAQLDDGIAHTFVSTAVSECLKHTAFSLRLVLEKRSKRRKLPAAPGHQGIVDTIVQLLYSPHLWLNRSRSRCTLIGVRKDWA